MSPVSEASLDSIFREFAVPGELTGYTKFGSGHINDTYIAYYDVGSEQRSLIHQRINHSIFKDPVALMENIVRVTEHIASKSNFEPRRSLQIVNTIDQLPLLTSMDGEFWRTYNFISDTRTFDFVTDPEVAYHSAYAFGKFQEQLADLPTPVLHETIPLFHHTPTRFHALMQAVDADCKNRAIFTKEAIAFALAREGITNQITRELDAGDISIRVTHNDTKVNNILFDNHSSEGLCVIDLDTVMPGSVLYDFGDMVRTTTCSCAEDETNLNLVQVNMPLFKALAKGYIDATRPFLTPQEKGCLAFSGKLITYEIGLRFLTDYLLGDVYFKTHRPEQNLDRARMQFALVRSIEEYEAEMQRYVDSL